MRPYTRRARRPGLWGATTRRAHNSRNFPSLAAYTWKPGGGNRALCHLQPQIGAHRPGGVGGKPGGAVPPLSGGPVSGRGAGGDRRLRGRGLFRQGSPAAPVPPDAGGHPPGAAGGPGVLPPGSGEPQRGGLRRSDPEAGGLGGGLPLHPGEVRHIHPHGQGHDVHRQRVCPAGAGDHRPAGTGQHAPAGPDGALAGGHAPPQAMPRSRFRRSFWRGSAGRPAALSPSPPTGGRRGRSSACSWPGRASPACPPPWRTWG